MDGTSGGGGATYEVVADTLVDSACVVFTVSDATCSGTVRELNASVDVGQQRLASSLDNFYVRWNVGVAHLLAGTTDVAESLRQTAGAYLQNDMYTAVLFQGLDSPQDR